MPEVCTKKDKKKKKKNYKKLFKSCVDFESFRLLKGHCYGGRTCKNQAEFFKFAS